MLSHGGFSGYEMIFRAEPVDLFLRRDDDCDSGCVQRTSISGQFAQKWKSWTMAPGATLKGIAGSKLRWMWVRNKSFEFSDV